MSYQIVFLGLINFFELPSKGRLVLIPDGRPDTKEFDKANDIAPHFASIFVRSSDVDLGNTTWPSAHEEQFMGEPILQYRITTESDLEITGNHTSTSFDDSDFEARSIKLKDRGLEIDPKGAATIVQMSLLHGSLVSRRLMDTAAAVLSVPDHKGFVKITARPRDKSDDQILTMKGGTEFVIVNMSDDLRGSGIASTESSHFRLYAQLDAKREIKGLVKSPDKVEIDGLGLGDLLSAHPFVAALLNPPKPEPGEFVPGVPGGQCSVTGCCAAWQCARSIG